MAEKSDNEDSDEERKDELAEDVEFDEAQLDITILEDEDEEKHVVYMRKRKGTYVVREMAFLRSDAKIVELAASDE